MPTYDLLSVRIGFNKNEKPEDQIKNNSVVCYHLYIRNNINKSEDKLK